MENQNNERKQLAFFGKMVASLSHEIMNVLATEKELSGLMEDLAIVAQKKKEPIDAQRIQSLGEKLSLQAERGETLVRRLNRFSHSVDEPSQMIDLQTILMEAISLCERFASLQKKKLDVEISEQGYSIQIDTYAFYQAMFVALDSLLKRTEENGSVKIDFDGAKDSCRIGMRWENSDPNTVLNEGSFHEIETQIKSLGGKTSKTDRGVLLTFHR